MHSTITLRSSFEKTASPESVPNFQSMDFDLLFVHESRFPIYKQSPSAKTLGPTNVKDMFGVGKCDQ